MFLARLGCSSDKIWNKVPYVSRPADKINKVLLRGIIDYIVPPNKNSPIWCSFMHCNLWISIFERSRCHLLFSEYPKDGKRTDSKISGGRDLKAFGHCFIFLISDPKQNARSLLTSVFQHFMSAFYALSHGTLGFTLRGMVAFSTFSYWLLKI